VTVSGNNGQFTYFDGPSFCIAQGWDGRSVPLGFGDSIVHAADDTDARGNSGYLPRSFDDPAGGRMSYGDVSVGGGSWRGTNDAALNGGKFGRRAAMLNAIAVLNGGAWPFTHIVSQMGVNDASSVVSEADPFLSWQSRFVAGWKMLQELFPGVPIVQTTLTPRNQTTAGYFWSDRDKVVWNVATDGPGVGAPRQRINNWLASRPAPLHAVIDVRAAFYDMAGDRYLVPQGRGVLAAAAAAGATSVTTDVAPTIGEYFVVEAGGVGAENAYPITDVTGAGPYTVTLGSALAYAHAAGSAWALAATRDGTHPSPGRHTAAKAIVINAKLAGVL
jgi:hypothetical protein